MPRDILTGNKTTVSEEEILLPDRCDLQKLYQRMKKMPLQKKEMADAFSTLYPENQDKDFGEFIRKIFSWKEQQDFWASIFEHSKLAAYGFSN